MDSDIVIPDHILEQYFRLQNRAEDYLNRYIRHYRAEQMRIEEEQNHDE